MAKPSERETVSEFFELFKTPWEFYRAGRRYDVVLCAGNSDNGFGETGAKVVLNYAGRLSPGDHEPSAALRGEPSRVVCYQGKRIPIYGECISFPQRDDRLLIDEATCQAVAYRDTENGCTRARIGYDLFEEVRMLLTTGQPAVQAGIATLDLHIALLRDLILAGGVPLAEIPPLPHGYPFLACLTHDVDHPSLRQHKFDHTMFGFLYRATSGSLLDVIRGRMSVPDLLSNWAAAFKLPLVHLGLAKDIWHRFQDYPKIEKGLPSSFFVIPFKGRRGRSRRGMAPRQRASGYGAAAIAPQIRNLMAAGCEMGLHGIDAWCDSSAGREEVEEIRRITGAREVGARMHWLYFDEDSPQRLDHAGVSYDSTVGYNHAVGFRAGTTQAYKPLAALRLMELPLHVMDTALFFPGRLNLSLPQAKEKVVNIVDQAGQFGGCITINWHDRSIAPERQWGRFYEWLVDDLRRKGAWFATAAQTVAWFRKRRSAVFESARWERGMLRVKVAIPTPGDLPALRLRIHRPRKSSSVTIPDGAAREITDITLNGNLEVRIPLESPRENTLARESLPHGCVTRHVN